MMMTMVHGQSPARGKYRPLPGGGTVRPPAHNDPITTTSTGGGLWSRLHILKVLLVVGFVLTILNLFNYRFDMKLERFTFLRNGNNSSAAAVLQQNISSASPNSPAPPHHASEMVAVAQETSNNFGPMRLRPHDELKPPFVKSNKPPDKETNAVGDNRSHDYKSATNRTNLASSSSSSSNIIHTNHSSVNSSNQQPTFSSPNSNDNPSAVESGQKTTKNDSVPVAHKPRPPILVLNATSSPSVPQKDDDEVKQTQDAKNKIKMPTEESPAASSLNSTTDSVSGHEQLNKTEPTDAPPSARPRTKFSGYIQTTSARTATSFLSKLMTKLGMNACPETPPDLHGPLEVDLTKDTVAAVEARLRPFLLPGGWYRPAECNAKDRVAIIIPFRDREEHLPILLKNLHPMLMRQQVNYGIFLVEETKADPFNRASLMNVGFLEANKMENWDCFIFHDVDLIPLNDRNLYRCPEQPRHMSVAIDVFDYKLPYFTIFGGVSALTKQQFHSVNGFSNLFWGWGGEDDDMSNRLRFMGYHISRYPMNIARYTMLSHAKAKPNPKRYEKLSSGLKRYENDGLNSVQYKLVDNKKFPLFTWLLVKLQPEVMEILFNHFHSLITHASFVLAQSVAGKLEAMDTDDHPYFKYVIVLLLGTLLMCIFKALLF